MHTVAKKSCFLKLLWSFKVLALKQTPVWKSALIQYFQLCVFEGTHTLYQIIDLDKV